jgi:hypothetical protein
MSAATTNQPRDELWKSSWPSSCLDPWIWPEGASWMIHSAKNLLFPTSHKRYERTKDKQETDDFPHPA